jgi:hypothetical protein
MQHILNSRKPISSCCLVGTIAWAFLLLMAAPAAFGQDCLSANNSLDDDKRELQPSVSETVVDRSRDAAFSDLGYSSPPRRPRWTATADFIILDRIGSVDRTLVETVNGTVSLPDLYNTPGAEVLNANDLHQGFSSGPRVGLIRHGDNGCDIEFSFFEIDSWDDYRSIGPTPNDWLVMRAPGAPKCFLQAQDHKQTQMMAWDYASQLYNGELNLRWNACARLTLLAGFRWTNLSEDLRGTLPELPGTKPQRHEPFWDANVRNNLYGFQLGGDAKLFERGRFSIDGLIKAGVFCNNAAETTAVSIDRHIFWESDATNHLAFLGETGLQCKYQATQHLLLKLGYEALWLQGVALASGQIQETFSYSPSLKQTYIQALGVNCGTGVFYHGATAGFEYSF